MTAIGSAIEQLREERGWTPACLGDKVGLSESEIMRRESGQTSVKPDERFAFAQAFGMSIIEFDERWRQCATPRPSGARGIPLLNRDSTGAITNYENPDAELGPACDYIEFNDIDDTAAFGLIVVGDSMSPTLEVGDCVILTPVDPQRADGKLEPGKIVFARFSEEYGGGCVLARYEQGEEDCIRLERDEPAHAPILCRREDIGAMAVMLERRESRQR